MSSSEQLDLLSPGPERDWREELHRRVTDWAKYGIYFGASSWKYPGWLGQVYTRERYLSRGRFSSRQFEQHCLEEYAETFPTLCGDFSFHRFYPADYWRRLLAQVPAAFQFGFKAPQQITAPHQEDGRANPDFLNVALARAEFLGHLLPFRQKVGYIVFEFPQFPRAVEQSFLPQLDRFLTALPTGLRYGVEVRTDNLLGPEYFKCLHRHGAAHVFNSWTRMPTIGTQLELPDVFTADFVVVRALLRPGRTFAQAVQAFQPYTEIRDPYPEGYRDVAQLVRRAKREVFVAAGNRFAGNAPLTIRAVLDELDKPGNLNYMGGGERRS